MKMCGLTLVSSFLVAMCDSRVHDIKHISGMMLCFRGLFTMVVESLIAADNVTALFQLTYHFPMCILAQKVKFNKLQTEHGCISKHSKPRHPASHCAEFN